MDGIAYEKYSSSLHNTYNGMMMMIIIIINMTICNSAIHNTFYFAELSSYKVNIWDGLRLGRKDVAFCLYFGSIPSSHPVSSLSHSKEKLDFLSAKILHNMCTPKTHIASLFPLCFVLVSRRIYGLIHLAKKGRKRVFLQTNKPRRNNGEK